MKTNDLWFDYLYYSITCHEKKPHPHKEDSFSYVAVDIKRLFHDDDIFDILGTGNTDYFTRKEE